MSNDNNGSGSRRIHRKIGIAGAAFAISIISVLFTGLQYFQTQRPRLGFHEDSKRINKPVLNEKREHYKLGFVFQNGGNLPCKGAKLKVTIFTAQRKIGTYEKDSVNDILPGSLFSQIVDFDMDWATKPEDLFFFIELEYPKFLFGKHRQDVYLTFGQTNQVLYHSDTPEVVLVKRLMNKSKD